MTNNYKEKILKEFREKFGGNAWLGADRQIVELYLLGTIDQIISCLPEIKPTKIVSIKDTINSFSIPPGESKEDTERILNICVNLKNGGFNKCREKFYSNLEKL